MITIKLDEVLSSEAIKFLKDAPKGIEKGIRAGLFTAGQKVRTDGIRMAPVLSGNLRRSITTNPRSVAGIKDHIDIGTNLIYARIHDLGGVIKPKRKNYLVFKINGKWVRTKKVTIPKYKGRGYLTPAFNGVINVLDKIMLGSIKKFIKI